MSAIWGLMAVSDTPEELVKAAQESRGAGYRKFDAHSPFPIDGLPEAMELHHDGVAPICWIGGLVGATSGFGLLTWDTVIKFPLNVGGRPYFSWPAYVPITFELMVLFAGVSTFVAVIALNRLPRLHHPTFNVEEFQRRNSTNGFFLVIESEDRKFDFHTTHEFLRSLKPARTYEVPHEP